MKPVTQEWVDKAEGDWASAGPRLAAQTDRPTMTGLFPFPTMRGEVSESQASRSNDRVSEDACLEDLLDLILPIEPAWQVLRPAMKNLSAYAVSYRYPGLTATRTDARNALRFCQTARETVRLSLGLPV